jgi:hypothetical protein
VTTLTHLKTLHRMAETYGTTPAAQVGIDDPLLAFCVNRACFWAGSQRRDVKAMDLGGTG